MKAVDSGMSLLSGSGADMRVYGGFAGVISAVAAGLVLARWIFDVAALRAVLPGTIGMRPRVALAFVLAGISLVLFCLERGSATKQRLAQGLAALVVLLAIAALGENALAAGGRGSAADGDRDHPSGRGRTHATVADPRAPRVARLHGAGLEPGPGGLEQSARHDGPIHLLVTDVIMPEMSGSQVAERLATSRPGMKVLFISGYTDDVTMREGLAEADVVFLQKPFTLNALARKVRQALDNPNGG